MNTAKFLRRPIFIGRLWWRLLERERERERERKRERERES